VLPSDDPKYLVMVMLDEPQGLPETHGYATAAWNSGVAAANVVTRIGPLLRLTPRFDLPTADKQILGGSLASARPTR